MKHQKHKSLLRIKFGVFLPIFVVFSLLSLRTNAQGWTFNFQLAYSGNCGGAGNITLPDFPQNTFQTQAQCESLRQQILAISVSGGGCTVYYKCTPCTGSDIVNPSESNPGDVSFNLNNGKPFFVPHQSKAFEEWSKNYKDQLASYGITSILGQSITPNSNLPLSGNPKVNKKYSEDADKFKPKGAVKKDVSVKDKDEDYSISGKTVPIMGNTPMTVDEIQRQKLINKYGAGYIDQANNFTVAENNEISSQDHPVIDIAREIGVTVAGWAGPAGYIGVVGVNIWAENAKGIKDAWDGKPCPSTETMLTNAYENTKKDIKSKLPGDLQGEGIERGLDYAAKGVGEIYGKGNTVITIATDLVGKNGIFDKIEKAAWILVSDKQP